MKLNRVIALAAVAALLTLACTGLGMLFEVGEEDTWLEIHEAMAFAFVGLIAVHLGLHWRQIVAIVRKGAARTRLLMGEYILLLGVTIASVATAAMSPGDEEEGGEKGERIEMGLESIAADVHAIAGILLVGFAAYHLSKRRRLLFGVQSAR